MENQVTFKVYVNWGDEPKPEIRRFGVEKSVVTSFHHVNAKLQDVYPQLGTKIYSIFWKDDEEDDVMISSDEELMSAVVQMSNNVIKLYVNCLGDGKTKADKYGPDSKDGAVFNVGSAKHGNVICDGCNGSVVGYRYKCSSCPNYDLCIECEVAGVHPEHCMVRIPTPTMPFDDIKSAIKNSNHFLKSIDPKSKRNRDSHRSGDRKREETKQQERRVSPMELTCVPPGCKWLTPPDYIAHIPCPISGLAFPIGSFCPFHPPRNTKAVTPNPEAPKPPQRAQTGPPKPPQRAPTGTPNPPQNTQTGTPNPPEKPQIPQSEAPPAQAQPGPSIETVIPGMPNLADFKNLTESVFKAMLPQFDALAKQMVDLNVKIDKEDRELAEMEKSLASESLNRQENGDKVDEWTMINQEIEAAAEANGQNLPQEKDAVTLNERFSLYPPLNSSTAVLNPQAPKATPAATAPEDPAHPNPNVEAALKHMMSMGFSNEGGWLTQLLEKYDGDITKVIDIITVPLKQ